MASLNVEIGGTPVRIACPRRIARRLRAELADHLVETDAPLGFLVRPTTLRQRSYVLTDRCGFVLGSARRLDQVLAMLGSHLGALRPLRDGCARLRLRALTDGTSVTVCGFPVLFVPAFDERQLEGTGHWLIDRLAIDVDAASGCLSGEGDSWFGDLRPAPGHSGVPERPQSVDRLLLAGVTDGGAHRSSVAARIAAEALRGERTLVLDAAIALVQRARALQIVDIRTLSTTGLKPLLQRSA